MKGAPLCPNVARADNGEGEGVGPEAYDRFVAPLRGPGKGGEGGARRSPAARGAPQRWAGATTRAGVPRGLSTRVLRWRTAWGRIRGQTRLRRATPAPSTLWTAGAYRPCLGEAQGCGGNRQARVAPGAPGGAA